MTSQPAHQRALDELESSLNSIFLQIGATFAAPANLEPANLPRTRAELQQSIPKLHYSFQHALDRLEHELNHARSVLHRDMKAMSTKPLKPVINETIQDGHLETETKEESAMVNGMAEAALDTNQQPSDDAMNLDPPQHSTDSNMTTDALKLAHKDATGMQEQTQDGEASGAPLFNDEDLFGFEPSPLPDPQPVDLNMEDVDGGVPIPSTEAITSASQAPETMAVNGTTDDLDDLFGENGQGTEGGDMNTTEQQDTEVNALLPGLEFYANENNATPGGLDALGDISATGMGSLEIPELNGLDDGSGFMANDIGDGQTAMMEDSTFDDWLSGLGGGTTQNGDGQANGEDAQFDANFFNLD